MINTEDVRRIIGTRPVDSDGSRLGKVGQVYLDDQTGRPKWATVSIGPVRDSGDLRARHSPPLGPHASRRTVGTVGLNHGIPLRDVQRLLRHARPESTLASCDFSGDVLERHASHQVAGFLAGWAG